MTDSEGGAAAAGQSPVPQSDDRGRRRAVLGALMLVGFVDTLGAFLVLALLPYYATRFGADALTVGALVSTFSFAQTLSAPLWGRASDHWGRRPVLLGGLLVLVLSFVAFALADSLVLLLLSRLAQGVGAGTVSAAFALVADLSRPTERAVHIGWLTAATSGAAVVGPAIGSVAVGWSPAAPGWVAAGICGIALVMAWSLLPKTVRPHDEAAAGESEGQIGGDDDRADRSLGRRLLEVVTRPGRLVHQLIWTYVLGMLGTSAVLGIIGLVLAQRFGVQEDEIWWFFALLAGASLIIRVAWLPRLLGRLGDLRVLVTGVWLLALALLVLPWMPSPLWIAVPTLLLAAGQSLLYPPLTAQIANQSRGSDKGAVLGVQQAWGGAARIVGPLFGGWLLGIAGVTLPFLVVGALLLLWAVSLGPAGRRLAGA